ncbi:peptidase S10 [Paraburkholderia nemoris]|uniref:S10 family serine carboxypeptidase-like protein n=1 Tax=Paraburkholderia nemoris TaxID=2793076 RepID=UPI0038B821E9
MFPPNTYRRNLSLLLPKLSLNASEGEAAMPYDQGATHGDPTHYTPHESGALRIADVRERSTTTSHTLNLKNKHLRYTATVGHLSALSTNPRNAAASLFYVDYVVEDSRRDRPVTFVFDGGPGYASIYLLLDSMGPVRIERPSTDGNEKSAFRLVDNQESLLEHTDLVFVDAIGTGYSQAIEPNTNRTFWNVDNDAQAFRDFVTRYLFVNGREHSPFYLYGNSYGAIRASVMANLLTEMGRMPTGLVLSSPALDLGAISTFPSVVRNGGVDAEREQDFRKTYANFIPTYAANAVFYGHVPRPASLKKYLRDDLIPYLVEQYDPALEIFLRAKERDRQPSEPIVGEAESVFPVEIVTTMKTFGVDLAEPGSNFNPAPSELYDKWKVGYTVERFDSRLNYPQGSQRDDEYDRFITKIVMDYLQNALDYSSASPYVVHNNTIIRQWGFQRNSKRCVDVIPDLEMALSRNPKMKILSVVGYFDFATPFYQTHLDLGRIDLQDNIKIREYEAGHGIYDGSESVRLQIQADLTDFYLREPSP